MSIVSYLRQHPHSNIPSIDFFYTTRYPASNDLASVLFLTRLRSLFDDLALSDTKLRLYLTRSPNNAKSGLTDSAGERPLNSSFLDRVCFNRIARKDLVDALGPPSERSGIVAYVCGVPPMTDQFVNLLQGAEGMDRRRVRCEKWW